MPEIITSNGLVALVDDEDHERFGHLCWWAFRADQKTAPKYYVCRTVWQPEARAWRQTYLHREIMNAPSGMFVDHINGNPLDNRRANLRLCTPRQNSINRRYANQSGYRGVYISPGKRPRAIIESHGIAYRLGSFDSPEEAARAYDAMARELHGEFAILNFPDQRAAR
jgi:hypothetical protein